MTPRFADYDLSIYSLSATPLPNRPRAPALQGLERVRNVCETQNIDIILCPERVLDQAPFI